MLFIVYNKWTERGLETLELDVNREEGGRMVKHS